MSEAITVKERPIIMTGESVRAILEGRKVQTRRVVKPQPKFVDFPEGNGKGFLSWQRTPKDWLDNIHSDFGRYCPYGQPGDRLWVRETWRTEELPNGMDGVRFLSDNGFREIENTVAAADAWIEANYAGLGKWRSPIFMPRWASRLTLEITGVRVERLQEINGKDARAEGVFIHPGEVVTNQAVDNLITARYRQLWDSINRKRGYGWETSPWVWVISFRRVEPAD